METQKARLEGLPEECLEPLSLEILFENYSNKISKKDNLQLADVAIFLRDNPDVQIELVGNIAGSISDELGTQVRIPIKDVVGTPYIMSNPQIYKDLMMIRAYSVKMLFEKMGVNGNQIHVKAGKALGQGSDKGETNKKVVINYI